MIFRSVDSPERGRLEQALVVLQRMARRVEVNLGVWESAGDNADVEYLNRTKGVRDRVIGRAFRPEELVGVYNTVRSLEALGVREPAEGDQPMQIAYQAKLWSEVGPCLRSYTVPAPISEEGLLEATRLLINQGKKERAHLRGHTGGGTYRELLALNLPPIVWILQEMLTCGLAILAGAPKLGKSWLSLQLSVAINQGDSFLGRGCDGVRGVLYLALEDTNQRVIDRLRRLGVDQNIGIDFKTEWEPGEAGRKRLAQYLDEHTDVGLVLVDTIIKLLGSTKTGSYRLDYDAVGQLKQIADEHEVAIVAVHHTRKTAAKDPLELLYGSNGLAGAADTLWVLSRGRGLAEANLLVTGRDVPEANLPLAFDHATGAWSLAADGAQRADSAERQRILDAMADGTVMTTGEIAAVTGRKESALHYHLGKLAEAGLIARVAYGKWAKKSIETESQDTDAESQQGGAA